MVSSTEGWIIGDRGAMLRFDGSAWRPIANPPGGILYSVSMSSGMNGWIGRSNGFLRYSHGRWEEEEGFSSYAVERAVVALPGGEAWAVETTSGFVATIAHFDGGTWRVVSTHEGMGLRAVTMISSTEGWAVGSGRNPEVPTATQSVILHFPDGQWQRVSSPGEAQLLAAAAVSPSEVWAVGESGTILRYDGVSWQGVPSLTQADLRSVAMLPSGEGWAVGREPAGGGGLRGAILHYLNGAWKPLTEVITAPLSAVAMVSPTDVWAVGDGGTILHYDGRAWQSVPSPTRDDLKSIAMVSPCEAWVVGTGSILHYDIAPAPPAAPGLAGESPWRLYFPSVIGGASCSPNMTASCTGTPYGD